MTAALVIACAATCIALIGRNLAAGASLPEPVFFGGDGFGCVADGAA
jgi:hypothetical protein